MVVVVNAQVAATVSQDKNHRTQSLQATRANSPLLHAKFRQDNEEKNAYDFSSFHNRHLTPDPKLDKIEISEQQNATTLPLSFPPLRFALSFPPTQTSPGITCRWLLSSIASSRVVSIPARTTGIVCRLHRTVVLRWWAGRWRRGVPAWWELLLLLLLLAICMLCGSWLAVVLLPWRK